MASLLPGDPSEFRAVSFWEGFFSKLGGGPFEWYASYDDLIPIISRLAPPTSPCKILHVGSGNSDIPLHMARDNPTTSHLGIDISPLATNQMKCKAENISRVSFRTMDVLDLSFEDQSFDASIDKGTFDAIMIDDSDETAASAQKMFGEIRRVVKWERGHMMITLAQSVRELPTQTPTS